jgi:hypothetical protein
VGGGVGSTAHGAASRRLFPRRTGALNLLLQPCVVSLRLPCRVVAVLFGQRVFIADQLPSLRWWVLRVLM